VLYLAVADRQLGIVLQCHQVEMVVQMDLEPKEKAGLASTGPIEVAQSGNLAPCYSAKGAGPHQALQQSL